MNMMPYTQGLILDNTNNYGIVKTETVFGFGTPKHEEFAKSQFNTTDPLEWIFTHGNFERNSLQDAEVSRSLKNASSTPKLQKRIKKKKDKRSDTKVKKLKRKGKKKCIFKVFKKGGKKHRRGNKFKLMHKKYMMPLLLGLLAAKSLLIPIALKALAFLSTKGLMMAFFSTVMASVLSLKGMFDHSHGYNQNRKDDTKTQVEIIQVPTKTSDDHVYYDDHYRRGDYVPIPVMQNE